MSKFSLDLIDEYPFVVYGITSSSKDYRLCWYLNKELGISFSRKDPITIINKKKETVNHELFVFEDENVQIKYRLIENKKGPSTFLPEAGKADYLLVLDESPVVLSGEIANRVRKIRPVLLVFEIKIDQLKNKENLLLTA